MEHTVYLKPNSPIGDLDLLTFQYTPQLEYSHDAKYDAYSLTHTNYQQYAYIRSENPTISLSCKFSAHTTEHFAHSEKAIRFLRTYTKMNYGRNDPQRGQPPRILRLFAYGNQMFNDVPVVISKFGMTFPEDMDYVTRNSSNGEDSEAEISLPIYFNINISLLVQQNLYKVVNEFNLEDFANGKLAKKGYV